MKKSMLLVGAFLAVAAMAQAKEVVPAPVVVEEAPVQIVEKEVIVYRDKEEGFRPNGFVDLQYKYYGNTENDKNLWNGNDNTSRTQLEGKIQMTEKQAFEYRVRDYNSLDEHLVESSTQTRLRYYYDHGNIEGTNIGRTSFLQYEKTTGQEFEYQYRFDLTDYFFNNDFIKTTNFIVGPSYKYGWGSGNDSDYYHSFGLYLDWINQLPWGFSTELEIDGLHYNIYGDNARVNDGANKLKDNDISAVVNLYLKHDANLYSNGAYSLDWHFEGGFDSYKWYNRDEVGYNPDILGEAQNYTDGAYEAYIQPSITLSYQATEFVTLYGTLGAEYRDWVKTANSEAQDWRWQPYAIVGFRTAF